MRNDTKTVGPFSAVKVHIAVMLGYDTVLKSGR
jgi:hypothetical protein